MISFVGAIRLGFQRYSDFNGRSTRAEYWWWFLFVVLTGIALTLIDMSLVIFGGRLRGACLVYCSNSRR